MEVTKSNFIELLPQIEDSIKESTFLSIDCEFTGLNVTRDINAFDTPRQYYEKLSRNIKDFLVIQYGISAFKYDPDRDKFFHRTYNFYIFRRPVDRNIPDQRFLCQSSSIDFLISHGFDFNKLFREGLPYLNIEEEKVRKKYLDEKYDSKNNLKQNNSENIPIPENAQPFVDDVMDKIEAFLEGDEIEMALPKCNSFIRRLIYQTAPEKFHNKVALESRLEDKDRIMYVTRQKSEEERKKADKHQHEANLKQLDDFVGFTKVLRIIVDSGKLVVGHNLCMDILHSMHKFLTPLPDCYEEFKECAHSLFPRILDTKYMAHSEKFNDLVISSILKSLLETVSTAPFQMPVVEAEEDCCGYNINDNKEHEAGYDAYVTGLCFLSMWKYLGKTKGLNSGQTFGNFNLLSPYLNRLFLIILTDNQFMHLDGEDPEVSRDHVFHINFPSDWKLNNIQQMFSPFGNVRVVWLDDSSAYVGLFKKDQAALALKTISQSDVCSIMTYEQRQAQRSAIRTPLKSPLVSKRRKSSEALHPIKKRRTDSFGSSGTFSKRSIEPIVEENQPEEEDIGVPIDDSETGFNRKASKTFIEDEAWE